MSEVTKRILSPEELESYKKVKPHPKYADVCTPAKQTRWRRPGKRGKYG